MLGLVLLFIAFKNARVDGDGTEYVMMAHGFYRHATPEIRPSDIAEIKALPEALTTHNGLPVKHLADVPEALGRGAVLHAGFSDGKDWGIQAIHFWMYSLLATPFYAVFAFLGHLPAMAFSALNFLIIAVTAGCILRWFPRAGLAEAVFIALLGPVFYLHWTGPEIFSACCAMLATLAMFRRDPALAIALAGFGATQNPSIAGLIPAACVYWGLLALRPAWALWPAVEKSTTRNTVLALAGVLLAALPYLHNQVVFGMPSIIAVYFTNPDLISRERFFSLFLDLNQGLVVGFPGLLLALALLPALLDKPLRFRWSAYAAGAACLALGMAFPALATVNWNSGYSVVLRYAYWAAMPVVAVCIVGLTHLPAGRRRAVLACVVVCQALTIWQAGGHTGRGYLKHTRLADWVLDHAPHWYNPDPEVFLERETQKEQDLVKTLVIVHHGARGPTKMMRYWSNTADSGGVCAPDQVILSAGVRTVSGWEYFNAPFQCGHAKQ